jgi:predicted dehydrogenase
LAGDVRVVVHGTGSIGMRHLAVLKEMDGVTPVAVSVRPERASELEAQGWETARSASDAAAKGARVAVIATDTARHVLDACAALDADLSVLVEKPLAADGRALSQLARAVGGSRRIFVACNLRFHAGLLRFRELVPKLGRIHAVRVECQSYLPDWRPGTAYRESYSARADEGGVLRDLVHEIDYATWIFGRPAELSCRLSNTGALGIAAEEAADLWWEGASGVGVSVRLDYLTRATRRRMTAFGEHGELAWDAIAGTVRLAPVDGQILVAELPQDRDAMMRAQLAAFLAAAGGGDPATLATFDDGAFAVALCDAARASSSSKRAERIAALESR